jgi:hypothetical protein
METKTQVSTEQAVVEWLKITFIFAKSLAVSYLLVKAI